MKTIKEDWMNTNENDEQYKNMSDDIKTHMLNLCKVRKDDKLYICINSYKKDEDEDFDKYSDKQHPEIKEIYVVKSKFTICGTTRRFEFVCNTINEAKLKFYTVRSTTLIHLDFMRDIFNNNMDFDKRIANNK